MRTRLVAGFTLIEVAITMVILAAGTISLLFLQLANLKAARETAARSAAMQYSVELADWIRVAAAPMAKAGTTVESVLMARNTASEATLVAHPTSCFDTICDPDQQATFALGDWDKRLRLAVPGARVQVCRDAQPWNPQTRSWRWYCAPATANAKNLPLWIKVGWPRDAAATEFSPTLVTVVGPVQP